MSKITVFFLGALLFGGMSFAYAEWKAPTATPPNENVAAPVNVGEMSQDKQGVLTLGGLGVFGKAIITSTGGYTIPSTLQLGVNGKVGAKEYCDENGQNCQSPSGANVTMGNISPDKCRIAVSGITGTWAQISCSDTEVMTGGGCRSHGGAYSYYDYPFMEGDKMWWGCASGSTGTLSEAFAICCSVGNTVQNDTSHMTDEEIARCINPSTWTWICGPVE